MCANRTRNDVLMHSCEHNRFCDHYADETDWKVIVIDREDRWAPELNDVEDVERLLPGVIPAIREWFRT